MKLIKSLKYRGNLLKENSRKITSQEGGFLMFFRLLMSAGLLLMKSVLTPLATSVFLPFELTAAMLATDTAIQKNIYGSGTTASTIPNEE